MNVGRILQSRACTFLEEVVVWVFLVFVLCGIPIITSPFFSDLTTAFSSLLAYSFTLMAVQVYAFHHIASCDGEKLWLTRLRLYLGIGLMLGSISFFFIYNFADDMRESMNVHLWPYIIAIAFITLLAAACLNWPIITKQVEDRMAVRHKTQMEEATREANAIKSALEKEANR
jgi:amino acid transporter